MALCVFSCVVFVMTISAVGAEVGEKVSADTNTTTCGSRIRREWRQLTLSERALVIKAVRLLKESDVPSTPGAPKGGYNKYPTIHGHVPNSMQAHGTAMFLPWHRAFIQKFEDDLRALGAEFACITIPYWDWSIEGDDGVLWDTALWNGDTDPESGEHVGFGSVYNGRGRGEACVDGDAHPDGCCVMDGPFRVGVWNHSTQETGVMDGWPDVPQDNACLFRFFGHDYPLRNASVQAQSYLTPQVIAAKLAEDHEDSLTYLLENGEHADVHANIGGYMKIDYSPEDPIFFLHHSNIDRLWAMWQVCHGFDNEASNVQYYADPGTDTGLHDEMRYHNLYDGASYPQPAQWSGLTPAKVWDLHHADLYAHSGPTGPKVQYEINDFNGGSAWAAHCPNVAATGQADWFVRRTTVAPPTQVPTQIPTQPPTQPPTQAPTQMPTQPPTHSPTSVPSPSPPLSTLAALQAIKATRCSSTVAADADLCAYLTSFAADEEMLADVVRGCAAPAAAWMVALCAAVLPTTASPTSPSPSTVATQAPNAAPSPSPSSTLLPTYATDDDNSTRAPVIIAVTVGVAVLLVALGIGVLLYIKCKAQPDANEPC